MKRKKVWIGILSVLLIVAVAAGGAYAFYVSQLMPVSSESHEVAFTIEAGESTQTVLDRLVDEKIIKNELAAKVYMKLAGKHEIMAGDFLLDTSWGTRQILDILNDPTEAKAQEVTLTITEGMWAKDIAALMEANTNVKAEDLLALWNDKEYILSLQDRYTFINEGMLNSEHVYLEGYLFPETYAFLKQTTPEAITERLLDHTQQILDQYQQEIEASSLSIHEIMTLASIVQYEANTEADMKLIAGVFYNRMKKGMKLQSSVTVCYALYEFDDWTDCETNSDLASPYNTYYVEGLPPGPILNPGEQAIAAVLHPTESSYLYFMADVYGDGKVYYAKTYAEHEANVNRYLR